MTTRLSSPLHAFFHWEEQSPENIFLRQPLDGAWREYTYRQAGDEIRRIASALTARHLPPQSHIAILSKNCAHWLMADLAIWMAGHVSVPIYPTLSAAGIQFILEHSEARLIFVGKLDNFETQRPGIGETVHRISFPYYGANEGDSWEDLLRSTPLVESTPPDPGLLASIMYSSGTTGFPKGIMLPFRAFDFVGNSLALNLKFHQGDRFISYLPLSHIAEKAYVEMGVLYSGGSVSFTESLEKFASNLSEIQPTAFGGVPRIYAKFQEGILSKISQKKLDFLLSIPLVATYIRRMLRKKLGFGRTRFIISGAAPLPISLLKWFKTIGIDIHEIYGMTENCGYSHGDHGDTLRLGTVGRTWPGVECKLGDEGEILTRHPGNMIGYFKDSETTAQVFTADGFLKTGDQGRIDNEGFLSITGRLKDQFKTDKGKFIVPAPIELKLLGNNDIGQTCVVGMGIPQPIALVVLSPAAMTKPKDLLERSLSQTLAIVNASLDNHERLAKIIVLVQDWTIENGLMTPSLKVKRNEVEKIHRHRYPKWYDMPDEVVWDS